MTARSRPVSTAAVFDGAFGLTILGRRLFARAVCMLVVGELCILLVACGGTDTYLRPDPATLYPAGTVIAVPSALAKHLTLHCLTPSRVKFYDSTAATNLKECLYVSADVSGVAGMAPGSEKVLLDTLLSVSDINCSTFLHRAFANRSGLDYTKTLLQDLATAGSAGAATLSGPAAAGLSGANLVIGKSIDSFTATYYFQQTFQAMESAINSDRQDDRKTILANEQASDYSYADVLADIRTYDDACSIMGGLAKLNEIAANADKTSKSNLVNAQQGTP